MVAIVGVEVPSEIRGPAKGCPAVALRRKLGHRHGLAGLFRRVDRRHDDPVGAAVEHQLGDLRIVARQPHQQIHAGSFDGQAQFVKHADGGRRVFHVDGQPVKTLARQNLGDRRDGRS